MHIIRKGKLSKKQLRRQAYKEQLEEKTGVRVADTMQMQGKWEWMRYFVNGFTAFLGSFGMIDCFLSSFMVSYNELPAACILLAVSLYIAMIYYRYKNIGYALFFIVYLQTILQFRELANSGFATILNAVQAFLTQEVGLPSASRYVESVSDTETAVSVCAIYIGCLIVVLLNIAISEYMNVGDIIVVTLPIAQLGMFFGRQPSAASFLMMLFSWIFVAVMKVNYHYRKEKKNQDAFRYKRKKHVHHIRYRTDSQANAQIILMVGAFVMATVTLLAVLAPSGFQGAVEQTNTWREDAVAQVRYLVQNGFKDFFSRQGAGGVNGGKLGEVGTVRFDNQTDIIVRMAPYKADRIYLKSYTGTDYTGRSWDVVNDQEWTQWRRSILSTSAQDIADAAYMTLWNRKNNSGDSAGDSKDIPQFYSGKMKITNTDANSLYMYLPYYSYVSDIGRGPDAALDAGAMEPGIAGSTVMNIPSQDNGDILAIVQDDLIYNKMEGEIAYQVKYIDTDLTLQQLDRILAEEDRDGYRAIVANTWGPEKTKQEDTFYSSVYANVEENSYENSYLEAASSKVSDVNDIYLTKRDGSGRQKIAYMEKEREFPKYIRKKLEKKGLESYSLSYRYIPTDEGAGMKSELYALGGETLGITGDSLSMFAETLMSGGWLYNGSDRAFWNIVNLQDEGHSTNMYKFAEEFIGLKGWYPKDKLYLPHTKKCRSLLDMKGWANSVFGAYLHTALNGIRSDDALYYNGYLDVPSQYYDGILSLKGEIPEAGEASWQKDEKNLITAVGLEDGSRHAVSDSLADYYYRGYVASHYLEVPQENVEVLAGFCEEYGIHAEDGNVLQKVSDSLEKHCVYVLNPGRTPTEEDFVNYFLTKQQQGFCVHFASAAALLYRYLGIPARYCEGYAIDYVDALSADLVGEEEPSEWVDRVTAELGGTAVLDIEVPDANAHAWVEIYLEDYGWVPVDPTPASGIENDFDGFWDEFGNDDEEGSNQMLQDIGMRVLSVVASRTLAILILVVLPCAAFAVWQFHGVWVRKRCYRSWHGEDKKTNVVNLYGYVTRVMAAAGNAHEAGVTYEEYADILVRGKYLSEEEAAILMKTVEEAAYAKTEPDSAGTEKAMAMMQAMVKEAYHRQKWYRRLIMKYVRNL